MALGLNAELLGDFALKEMDLRASRRQRLEAITLDDRCADAQARFPIIGKNQVKTDCLVAILCSAEERDDSLSIRDAVENRLAEFQP